MDEMPRVSIEFAKRIFSCYLGSNLKNRNKKLDFTVKIFHRIMLALLCRITHLTSRTCLIKPAYLGMPS